METESKLRLADVFVSISDPRQAGKVEHDLVELLAVAVNAVLFGADTFVEIELWAKEQLDWLRITLNRIRLDPVKRKGGIKARRLIAATSDLYRAQLLGLV